MDFFQHRYYRLNKILLQLLGLWPYQSIRVRVGIIAGVFFLALSILVPQLIIVAKHLDDRDFIMECAIPLIFFCLSMTKDFTSIFNTRKVLKLLNRMRMDWEIWGRDRDVDILHEYAEKGRKMTKLYTVMLTATCIIFVSQPVMPKIIDFLLKNGTEPGQFPIPVDYYYIDTQKYYFYIIMHCAVCAFFGFLMGMACDSMFMVYIQHNCGLFAVLRRKLERIGRNHMLAESAGIEYEIDKPAVAFDYLAWCIDQHNRAIEYAELLDATYSSYFFFVAAFNMTLISVEGVQIIERTNEPEITIKLICCIVVAMVHLYIENYMGQILMDYSISIHNCILRGKWYILPVKSQKLLPLMMMRCNVPCKLGVAKISVMSLETFGVILKTSLSYFTLLRSV